MNKDNKKFKNLFKKEENKNNKELLIKIWINQM